LGDYKSKGVGNRALRRIEEEDSEEVTGNRRNLRDREVHNLHSSQNIDIIIDRI
jgi:hypothetical protein